MELISASRVPRSENKFERVCFRSFYRIPLQSSNCSVCSELYDEQLALRSFDQGIKRASTERRHMIIGIACLLLALGLLVGLFISAMPQS